MADQIVERMRAILDECDERMRTLLVARQGDEASPEAGETIEAVVAAYVRCGDLLDLWDDVTDDEHLLPSNSTYGAPGA